jgi:hypothetical protein
MMVSYCTCERFALRDILAWARAHDTTDLTLVCESLKVGRRCGMCCVFIEYALATGLSDVPYPCPPIPPVAEPAAAGR